MHPCSARSLRPLSISLARFSSSVAIAAAMALAGSAGAQAAILDWDPTADLSNLGGPLTGSGKVTTTVTGTAQVELVVGNGKASGTFTGTVSGPISIRKTGTGTQSFTQSLSLNSLTIDGGEVTFGDGLNFAGFAPEAGFGAAVVPEPGALGLLSCSVRSACWPAAAGGEKRGAACRAFRSNAKGRCPAFETGTSL